jgi:hypothetical protein
MRKVIAASLVFSVSFVGGYALADRSATWLSTSATVDAVMFTRTASGTISARICGHADSSTAGQAQFRDCTDGFDLTSGSTIETQVLTLMNGQALAKWKAVFGF